MTSVRIIAVGGTIDALEYDFEKGKVLSFSTPAVEKILKTGRVRHIDTAPKTPIENSDADVLVLDRKDSLDMTDGDREKILAICSMDERERILITHGTDTMTATGKLLTSKIKNKTIVLTGSMRPFSAPESDAAFNVGGALVAAETLPHGVYIVVQGEVFPVDEVDKIRKKDDPHFERKSE